MRKMGIEALYQKPRLSKTHPGHTIYPYLLRGLTITEANRRLVLGYHLHPHGTRVLLPRGHHGLGKQKGALLAALEHLGYIILQEALEEAIALYGTPQIFNTDQGSQFTSDDFTDILKKHDIRISMDGQGRWMDNVFIERLWKSVKYEEIYLKAYSSIGEVRKGLTQWFDRYNRWRRHQGLDDRTPDEVYWSTLPRAKDAM